MIKKRLTAFLSVLLVLTVSAGLNAFAYDVDFSVKPQESSAKQGESVNVNIVITTQEQGYTEFEMQLLYDEAVFSCESTYNENGYVGSGKNGVYTLIYKDPSIDEPAPTQSGDVITIPVKFSVLSEATVGDTKLSASVIKCNGVNSLDLNSAVKLELAQLLSKTVKIEEGEPEVTVPDDTVTDDETQVDDESIDDLIDQPQITTEEEEPSYDWIEILGIIIGGIVVFFSGCVVGYLFKQKKSEGDSSRDGYYSPSNRRNRHSSYDNDDIDIGRNSSDYSGINGISKINESTQGSRTYGGSQTNTARSNAPQYTSGSSVPPVNIASENTFSGFTSTTGSYAGYNQAPMQTSYATGALQTAPQSQLGFGSGNAGQQAQNPYSAVAPKTYTSGTYSQQNNQWQNQSYASPQTSFNAPAQQVSSFAVQQNSAQATSFNGTQGSQIEMAYRGEGTVGTYRPTPPTQGAYAPAYSQFAPSQPQAANTSSQQNTTTGVYQPSAQKTTQQPPFKTEYTIGRPGYGTSSGQATQQGYSTSQPNGGSYIQQAANSAQNKQSAQPQASVQNRFLDGNQQSGTGYNNTYRR